MDYGRGAWTQRGKDNGTAYYTLAKKEEKFPRDGAMNYPEDTTPQVQRWYYAVHLAVKGIQQVLCDLELLEEVSVTGVFGGKTFRAVKQYQTAHGLTAAGQVGTKTMTELIHPIISKHSHGSDVNPKWIYGLARQESGLDPGAQGWTTPDDFGLWQHNTNLSVTPEEACDIDLACKLAVNRWVMARERWGNKGHQLQVDCCIIQHRSPVAADYLYEHEEPYGPESAEYVANVRAFAEQWK